MSRTLLQWQTDMINGINVTKTDKKFKFLLKARSIVAVQRKDLTVFSDETDYEWYIGLFRQVDGQCKTYVTISCRKDKDAIHRWNVDIQGSSEEFDTSTALLKYINR